MLQGKAKADYQREYMRKRREAQRVARGAPPAPTRVIPDTCAADPQGSSLVELKAEIERLTQENERLRTAAAAQGDAPVTRKDLAEAQKKKFDRALKAEFNRLQDWAYEELKAELRKHKASMHEDWKRKIEFAEDFHWKTRNMGFPFERDEFKLIRNCLHPDRLGQLLPPGTTLDEKVRVQYAEAFSLINKKEPHLVRPVPPPKGGKPFPKTVDEMPKPEAA